MSRVLIVEDEVHLAEGLRFNLEAEGHAAQVVSDGETALKLLLDNAEPFDVVLLDVMLPGIDGFGVVSRLRRAKNYVPVLILTARGRPEDVLEGFSAGADDYVAKPFQLPIFLARLQGLLRRREWLRDDYRRERQKSAGPSPLGDPGRETVDVVFQIGGKTIDFGALELRSNGAATRLTLMEAKLLRYLILNWGRIVSRKSILEEIWGLHEDTDTRAIDNFIVRLRRYLEEDPAHPRHLLTVRGVGYRFVG